MTRERITFKRTLKWMGSIEEQSILTVTSEYPDWKLLQLFFDSNADKMVFGSANMMLFDEWERIKDDQKIGDSTKNSLEEINRDTLLYFAMQFSELLMSHQTYGSENWVGVLSKNGSLFVQVRPGSWFI